MNCIFYYIFNDEKYIDIFYLFLESIFIFGNLNDNTHILVYTCTKFMNIIKESHLFNDEKIKFEINDNNETFELLNLKSISNYDKILCLGSFVLVKDDINKVFNFSQEDDTSIIYLEDNYNDECGILLFKNCEKNNISNTKFLNSLVANNDYNIHSDKVIHRFLAQTSDYENMSNFLNNIKEFTTSNNINKAKKYINDYLIPIINNCNELLEGNIFMFHESTVYNDGFLNKSRNISDLLLNKNIKNVMEIGFNAGFSTLLMLLTNPNMSIMCFDLGEHKYTLPCYEKLKETFGNRINIIIGDSTKTIKNINDTYDLIHIDGGHTTKVANCDIINSIRLSKQGTILIMDDYNSDNLHKLWDSYIDNYDLKSLNIKLHNTQDHDIKYILK